MPRKRKAPQSARSKWQKYLEKKHKDMEVFSNSQSSNDSKPLQTECHVADANSCNNNKSTRATLRLKRMREQSYEAYHEEPQAKHNKVKATYDRNPEVKCSQVKAAFNKDREAKCSQVKAAFDKDRQAKRNQVKAAFNKNQQAKQDKVKAAFDKDRVKKQAQMKLLYYTNPQAKKGNVKARYWKNPATRCVASKLLARARCALNLWQRKWKIKHIIAKMPKIKIKQKG